MASTTSAPALSSLPALFTPSSPSKQQKDMADLGAGAGASLARDGSVGKKVSSRENVPMARVQKQRQEIEALKHNNEMIRLDAIRGSREARINVKSGGGTQEVARLQDQAQLYFQKIQTEKRKIGDLEEKIKLAQMKVLEQKQKMGGVNASKENDAMIAKQIRILENRLDKTLIKFNQALAENKRLRERIDRLRMDRVVFDNVYKRLERSLHEKKKEMAQVIEEAKHVCMARDKAKNELAIMKQQADKEKAEFELEWKELGRLIEQDRHAREALKKKLEEESAAANWGPSSSSSSRSNQQQQQQPPSSAAPAKKETSSSSSKKSSTTAAVASGQQQASSSSHAKDKTTTNNNNSNANTNNNGNNINPLALSPDKQQRYEEAFAKVQEATGIQDIDEMVTKFLEAEEKNFSLFNYVNELNNEIEQLELLLAENKAEMDKDKDQQQQQQGGGGGGGGGDSPQQHKRLAARLMEDRLQRTKAKTKEYELKYQTAIKTINQLKTAIHGIFSRLGCAGSTAPMVEEMLGNQGVTESNMMQYLGIIEQRTIDILQMYSSANSGSNSNNLGTFNDSASASAIGATPRFMLQLPTFDEKLGGGLEGNGKEVGGGLGDYDDDEDEDRPLTREELQRKTFKMLTAGGTKTKKIQQQQH